MEWRFPGKIPTSAVQACISFAHMIVSSGECPVKFADGPERGLIASVHQCKGLANIRQRKPKLASNSFAVTLELKGGIFDEPALRRHGLRMLQVKKICAQGQRRTVGSDRCLTPLSMRIGVASQQKDGLQPHSAPTKDGPLPLREGSQAAKLSA